MADKYQKYLTSPPFKDKESKQQPTIISLIQHWKAWKGITVEHQNF